MMDEIDYEIIDGECSYCGRDAEWIEINDCGDGYLTCPACDSYNNDVEMGLITEENPIITVLFGR